ncbi:Bug family tripartite tricarboxylate transporter substrate binding protein [Cupriavidus sp. D39]|uniref:Bug family tripartite tricarboxylate transporter substrate binding protein n=1 Tax=Cupriavidus sp. D39 TaxID=2997877 RepID=UPI00226DC3A4|nr:tripartite tricarboxylate transporter substrate-binding protein [Cupriavidus sp. D39]MCY0855115.1 tripartite tricarboxylate transporter substrate-binding protein [Cupriavidus sp. D39]
MSKADPIPLKGSHRLVSRLLRKGIGGISIAVVVLGATAALAQDLSKKPIHLIAPMAPGGAVDTVSRLVGQQLSIQLGQPVVVENKPGAGGIVAASFVARSSPDGFTVFAADTGQLSINPSLYKALPYDVSKPFVPVMEAVTTPLFLAVNASLPIHSVKELIAYAKAHPLSYGSTGIGSVHQLSVESLAQQTGMKLTHVPYKGASPAAVALAANEVSLAAASLSSLRPYLDSGKIRLIAVTTRNRAAVMPNVPSVAESGVAGFDVAVGIGFVLPPGASQSVANRLHDGLAKAMASPDVKQKLEALGWEIRAGSQQQYDQRIRSDAAMYRKVIEAAGLRVE